MRSIFFFFSFCLAGNLFSQDDPCKITKISTKDSNCLKASTMSKSRQFNMLLAVDKIKINNNNYACKLSAASTFQNEISKQLKKVKMEGEVFDETSISVISDSVFQKDRDLTRLKGSIQIAKLPREYAISVSGILQSQKFNTFHLQPDSLVKRKLQSGPLSPGILTMALGLKKEIQSNIHLELGLAGTKITWISNKQLYLIQQSDIIAGVPKDKRAAVEGGFSFQGKIDKQLSKNIKFQNTTIVFKDIFTNHDLSIEFRNSLSWEPVKYISTAIRTVYTYDPNRWPPSLWLGEFNVGLNMD